ncbi:polyhydroxyalkanoate synthesis regulator DNA-binding domain-containing protein [Legionella nagasakiensis]|uniref:polyhydroxyalkanoate synthesis regulator DNA-binding domain-containing protein n=1 Tax=Legionella nagasakiensis TaxID=535290 RepID=UPI0010565EB6|nr:polyhydroxyalkanoate synthesis regulator DNA-binding domain-containing protein [Legionella nagasakiensis]
MTRLIKKYKNRRLYDTEKSRYITIDDLQRYVVDGLSFRVEEAGTGKDITNGTLMQILVEMEAGSSQFLSSEILRQLICLTHHPMNKTLKAMLEQMMEFMDKQMQASPYLSDYQQATDAWNKQMQSFFSQWQNFFRK